MDQKPQKLEVNFSQHEVEGWHMMAGINGETIWVSPWVKDRLRQLRFRDFEGWFDTLTDDDIFSLAENRGG